MKKRFISVALAISVVAIIGLTTTVGAAKILGIDLGTTNSCVAVVEGGKVQLVGFGTFETRERKAREGRNPSTGETISIPACLAPAFKAGKVLKDAVAK